MHTIYDLGVFPWPEKLNLPDGCSGIGIENGIAFFRTRSGEITSAPISALLNADCGLIEAINDLSELGVAIIDTEFLDYRIK